MGYAVSLLKTIPRILPWLATAFSANMLHYASLWQARAQARRRRRRKQLSFHLMHSPTMRLARYPIHLLRYFSLSLHLLLFHPFLPELHGPFLPSLATIEALVVGILSGSITIYMNENGGESMRTSWQPSIDMQSHVLGLCWDTLRLLGACFAVPIEEELFYRSWLYRLLCQLLSNGKYGSFVKVSFGEWNWLAWFASNAVSGVYNGKEWKSWTISGLLFQWVICRRGHFLDGVLAHAVRNLTISIWVLALNERQYW